MSQKQCTPTGQSRILLIDDAPILAETGKDMLERREHKLTIRTDSTEALNLSRAEPSRFDAVTTGRRTA